MQFLNVMVAVGGDQGNTVPKYDVTPAEVAVLQAIHGEGAVFDIEVVRDDRRSNAEELSRLRRIYGGARDTENNIIVDILFPGAAARVFQQLDELGLDESFMKPIARASATEPFGGNGDHDHNGKVGGAAPPVPAKEPEPADLHDLTVARLKEKAAAEGIDLGDATKKDDIIAAIEAASSQPDMPDDDGVGEMADSGLFE